MTDGKKMSGMSMAELFGEEMMSGLTPEQHDKLRTSTSAFRAQMMKEEAGVTDTPFQQRLKLAAVTMRLLIMDEAWESTWPRAMLCEWLMKFLVETGKCEGLVEMTRVFVETRELLTEEEQIKFKLLSSVGAQAHERRVLALWSEGEALRKDAVERLMKKGDDK